MKTILITGASTGIGRAAAQHFQREGWQVAATMRRVEDGAALAALDHVEVIALDVTDRASIQAAVARAVERFGGVDVLLNNAGYGLAGPVEAVQPDQLERQYATNVFGPIYAMQAVLPHMRAAKHGLILNVSSIGGRLTLPFNALYHGTKYALEGISESMALELAPLGIRVKIIEPGGVKTDFASRSLDMTRADGLTAYDPSLQGAMSVFSDPTRAFAHSTAEHIAAIIYGAATDGTDRLRYLAGDDAERMAAERATLSDEDYRATITERFKL
jgi:NAD(P)-dependent dehydrogenase (short-subunit alcohol dehydrogenase family)